MQPEAKLTSVPLPRIGLWPKLHPMLAGHNSRFSRQRYAARRALRFSKPAAHREHLLCRLQCHYRRNSKKVEAGDLYTKPPAKKVVSTTG